MKKFLALTLTAVLLTGTALAQTVPPTAQGPAQELAGEPAEGSTGSGSESPSPEGEPTVYDSIEVEDEAPKHKSVKSWLNAQPRKKKGAIKGALKGAGVGLLGALVTGRNPVEGAVVGAAAGALVGYLIGKRKDKIYAARDAAVEEIDYDPSQGYVMRIQEVRFDPPNLQPGESGVMHARYIVVGPDPKEKIVIQAYTGIKYDENYVTGNGPDKLVVRKGGGIIETTVPVTIPDEAPAGTYVIEAMFDDPAGRFAEQRRENSLYVNASETEEAT